LLLCSPISEVSLLVAIGREPTSSEGYKEHIPEKRTSGTYAGENQERRKIQKRN
jgi:hypothetical protein